MQEILVLPREHFHGLDGFVPWSRSRGLVDTATEHAKWMPRADAENSEQWVQPIPCAIFRDGSGRYCVFRQARQLRSDLSRRVSFIVGGHIDRIFDGKSVSGVIEETVKREVSEEVGIDLEPPLTPVGLVIDSSSVMASRHVGLVYEAVVNGEIKSSASDEFLVGSKYNGKFLSVKSLSEFRSEFDPWSFILFSQYLGGGFSKDVGRQPTLSMSLE